MVFDTMGCISNLVRTLASCFRGGSLRSEDIWVYISARVQSIDQSSWSIVIHLHVPQVVILPNSLASFLPPASTGR